MTLSTVDIRQSWTIWICMKRCQMNVPRSFRLPPNLQLLQCSFSLLLRCRSNQRTIYEKSWTTTTRTIVHQILQYESMYLIDVQPALRSIFVAAVHIFGHKKSYSSTFQHCYCMIINCLRIPYCLEILIDFCHCSIWKGDHLEKTKEHLVIKYTTYNFF